MSTLFVWIQQPLVLLIFALSGIGAIAVYLLGPSQARETEGIRQRAAERAELRKMQSE